MKRKSLVLTLAFVLGMGTVLAGCGSNNNGGSSEDAAQVFRMNLRSEPPTLDLGQAQDNTSFTVLNAIYEGLTTKNEKAEVQPGVAKDWKISDDGLTYTMNIDENAKWSNGDAVKASDFEFAWKRILDPNLQPASPYAYQLYYLKNGEEYNTKKAGVTADQVGVKAQDDKTLVITLKAPTPYFLGLLSFFTYFPQHEASVSANPAFAAEAATIIGNGPFTLAEWKHNDSITLKKSDTYNRKDEIKLSEVKMAMVDDASTELSMYDTDELDYTGAPTGEIPSDQIPTLKETKKDELRIKGVATSYYYVFNTTAEPFDNVNIRKAFAMSINRQMITDKVTLGGQLPAFAFVPPGIKGEKDEFRKEQEGSLFKEDNAEAKTLLEKGMQEKGYTKLPEITLIHNTGAGHKKIAEAIANMWKTNLGVDVKIEAQEWGVFLKNRTNLNYQVARAGWGADYNDPMTFIDMFTAGSGNNDTGWKNAEFDKLVNEAKASSDEKVRMTAMAKAEKMITDDMIIMPIYYYTSVGMLKPNFKNITIDYKGDINFSRGYIEE
ncbi:peptide-binding protein [Paenibacillus swuensis]|uniref:Peptide-binding protein n=1 Tax=Paenibacillus swuensis TaxID=1178515 RepID=A0A172TKB2_9BACL|nr:peptide ABC transporter substrate-binding protein [Paenibacillus swuensis]ANE47354.1 peptide-binding protein [Paenibacillus swuensis]